MMTIAKLLKLEEPSLNQTKLAEELRVSRSTLRKYMPDIKGSSHEIRLHNGHLQLMTLQHAASFADFVEPPEPVS